MVLSLGLKYELRRLNAPFLDNAPVFVFPDWVMGLASQALYYIHSRSIHVLLMVID
jgi:hypothetical protein